VQDLNDLRVAATAAPLRRRVADNLRNAIIEGRFKPGERLKEGELCAWTGVSRTAVREALRQLEAEGVVDNIPNRGPVVATVTPEEALQHYEVRGLLEGLVARSLASRITDADAKALHRIKKELERAAKTGSVKGVLEVKNKLDEFLASACKNTVVKNFLDVIRARLSYLRPIVLSQPRRLEENLHEINAIIDAIIAKDPEAAWRTSVDHVTKGAQATLKVLNAGVASEKTNREQSPTHSRRLQTPSHG